MTVRITRMVAILVTLGLFLAGCRQASDRGVDAGFVTDSEPVATAEPLSGNRPSEVTALPENFLGDTTVRGEHDPQAEVSQNEEPEDSVGEPSVLAGMYNWDPSDGFHNAAWSGTLRIDSGCPYLDDITIEAGEPMTQRLAKFRAYLRLPELLTRYDPQNGKIAVAGNDAVFDGDRVKVFGSEGLAQRWRRPSDDLHTFTDNWDEYSVPLPGCVANISLFAASMSPNNATDPNVPPASQLPGLTLFAHDLDQGHPDEGAYYGTLVIEPPCVYFEFSDQPSNTVNGYPTERYQLALARAFVRYDADTNTLRNLNEGPFTNGDTVAMWGGGQTSNTNETADAAGCTAAGTYSARFIEPA